MHLCTFLIAVRSLFRFLGFRRGSAVTISGVSTLPIFSSVFWRCGCFFLYNNFFLLSEISSLILIYLVSGETGESDISPDRVDLEVREELSPADLVVEIPATTSSTKVLSF